MKYKFSGHAIEAPGKPFKGYMSPIIDMGTY